MHVDLNLLTALDALLEEGSVHGAASRLHLTQPAMSRALARLRRATGDDLLVRVGRGMIPTPRALELRAQVSAVVAQAREVLTPVRTLDLSRLRRDFTIQGHDALVAAIAPPLLANSSHQAPHVAFRFLAEASFDTAALARAQIDLEVGSSTPAAPDVNHHLVGHDRIVVVMRRGHPFAGQDITAADFAAARHITVSRRGRLSGVIDDVLASMGLRRTVSAALPSSASALAAVTRSDELVVVAERLCAPLIDALDVVSMPVPFELPPIPLIVAWHRRYDTDVAHNWLRSSVTQMLQTLVDA